MTLTLDAPQIIAAPLWSDVSARYHGDAKPGRPTVYEAAFGPFRLLVMGDGETWSCACRGLWEMTRLPATSLVYAKRQAALRLWQVLTAAAEEVVEAATE